jgi:glycosyltransferase involved in cell wall biosynthesis
VVIPTHNRAELIREAIASVLHQTISVHEIVVVDDGSTDSTRDLVPSYGAPIVLLTQNHVGSAAARNRALAHATGDWVAFLDSDDVWKPTKLERQLQYVDHHTQCGLVHTGRFEFGGRDRVVPAARHFIEGDYRLEYLLFAQDWICMSSALVRRDIHVRFREWSRWSEDILYFGDLLRSGVSFGYVDEPLVGYRIHGQSVNYDPGSQVGGVAAQWRWIAEAFESQPDERRRLQHNLLTKILRAMNIAKWSRTWPDYWQWRDWLNEHWPAELQPARMLREPIYPPVFYAWKDRLEKLVLRKGERHGVAQSK